MHSGEAQEGAAELTLSTEPAQDCSCICKARTDICSVLPAKYTTNSPLYCDLLFYMEAVFIIGIKNSLLQCVIPWCLIRVSKNCRSQV